MEASASIAASPRSPRLVGREHEVRLLGQALDRISAGGSAITLIEGEAGIGKTRLLQDTLATARGRGIEVLVGRARELERTRPFGVVADALGCVRSSPDPRRVAIATLLTTHGGSEHGPITVTSDPGLQFRAVDALTDLLEKLALAGPVVLAVDDLQWADPSTLLTLASMTRRLSDLPIALIGCFRPIPRSAALEQFVTALRVAGTGQLTLHQLSDAAVRQLARETIAADPGPGLLTELAGAAGNPLFVTELIGALDQTGALHTADGQADITEAALPPTLRLTILHRLSFLPDSTLEVLRPAAMLGSTFSLTDLATVADRPALDLVEALAPAIRARVVADDGVSLLFRHDLIREAIYEDLPAPVRRELHREFGHRLALSDAPALQVAEHFSRGSTTGDVETISWLTRAAREVAAASPAVAADLLERAVRLTDPADPGLDRLLVEQASSLMWAGRVAAAEEGCRLLLDRAHDPEVDGPARICLGNALLGAGRAREALREFQCASQSPQLTGAERAGAHGWAGIAHLWLGDLDEAAATARQAQSTAASCEDHLSMAIALAVLAEVSELHGHLADALKVIDRAVRRADLSPDREGHRYPLHAVRGSTLIELDRLEEAGSTVEVGRRISEELGIGWHLPSYQARRSAGHFLAGEWDDAIVEVEASTDLAAETGLSFGLAFGHSVESLISLHRNDLSVAKAALDRAKAHQAEPGTHFRVQWVAWAQALILEADSRTADALAVLDASWDWCIEHGHTRECRIFGADMVRLALAGAAKERAREAAAHVAALSEQNPQVRSLAGAALRCRGLAENDPGLLLAAVDAYRTVPRPLEFGSACEDAGTALARRGDVDRARPLLEQAIGVYERLDAARDRARTEAVTRAAGIGRGRRGPRGRPQRGWRSLTPTEHTIATLVADGLSNPQIGDRLYISRRTVQAHLAHIFRKLDIGSRAQLAAETSRQCINGDRAN